MILLLLFEANAKPTQLISFIFICILGKNKGTFPFLKVPETRRATCLQVYVSHFKHDLTSQKLVKTKPTIKVLPSHSQCSTNDCIVYKKETAHRSPFFF